jgi:hypothetical protein
MALRYSVAIRNSRLNVVRDALDAGAGVAKLKIISGAQPSTGAAYGGTIIGDLTFTKPSASNAAAGVLTFSPIASDTAANASLTGTWARAMDSADTHCFDGTVGTSGADFIFPSVAFTAGTEIAVPTAAITAGNA